MLSGYRIEAIYLALVIIHRRARIIGLWIHGQSVRGQYELDASSLFKVQSGLEKHHVASCTSSSM